MMIQYILSLTLKTNPMLHCDSGCEVRGSQKHSYLPHNLGC